MQKRFSRPDPAVPTRCDLPGLEAMPTVQMQTNIARSLDFLSKNFRRPISVAHLVSVSRLSRRGFHKSFKQQTGQIPGRLMRRMRIEHAVHLLTGSALPVEEVSRRSGYRNYNAFYVAFRQVTGKSPRNFKKHIQSISE